MAISGIELSASVLVGTTKPVDAKYGPYAAASLSDATDLAKADITSGLRYEGLTAGIKVGSDNILEYWFYGGIDDENFVQKTGSSAALTIQDSGSDVDTNVGTINFLGTLNAAQNGSGTVDVSSQTFVSNVGSALSQWIIDHNLGTYPAVTTVNDSDQVVFGQVTYNSVNQVKIDFSTAIAGKAYFNV